MKLLYSLALVLAAASGASGFDFWPFFSNTPPPPRKPHPAPLAKPAQTDGVRLGQFWERAKKEVDKSPEELAAQNAYELSKGIHFVKLMHGDPTMPAVALTFDDGPHPKYTPKLLAILKRYNVKATFFVVGEMAGKYPDLVKQEVAAGHLIGNHTFHHVNLTKIPFPEIAIEWQAAQDVVRSITGKTPAFCRPPGGDYDRDVIKAAMDLGLTTVLWTDDPGDYASPGDRTIEARTLDRISNGGIILIHDGIQQTIDVLPQIIETLQKRGFRFVTVDELAKERADYLQKIGRMSASPLGFVADKRARFERPKRGLAFRQLVRLSSREADR